MIEFFLLGDYGHGPLDQALRYAGYIPWVSKLSGIIRIAVGYFDMIAGTFRAVAGFDGTLQHYQRAFYGIVEVLRGSFEMITLFGNIVVLGYDLYSSYYW